VDVLVALLAFTAGSVDALSYLGLGRIFTANQTGNLILLGLALGQRHALDATRSAVSLLGFLLGVVLANLLGVPATLPARWPAAAARALALEGAILLIVSVWGGFLQPSAQGAAILPYALIMAGAMGLQTVVVRALGAPGVTGTAITNTLTLLMEAIGARFFGTLWLSERAAGRPPSRRPRLLATVIGMYAIAAVITSVVEPRWLLAAAAIPSATVALVVGLAPRRRARLRSARR
jgi:uncharacterized membrane protein YoaK (UPF0700 family)